MIENHHNVRDICSRSCIEASVLRYFIETTACHNQINYNVKFIESLITFQPYEMN